MIIFIYFYAELWKQPESLHFSGNSHILTVVIHFNKYENYLLKQDLVFLCTSFTNPLYKFYKMCIKYLDLRILFNEHYIFGS